VIRRGIAVATAAAAVIAAGAIGSSGSAGARAIRIAYTTELHGNLMPCSCPVRPLGGLARRIGYVDSLRSATDVAPLFLVDAGRLMPSAQDFPLLSKNSRSILTPLIHDAVAEMGYDAIAGVDLEPNQARVLVREGVRVTVVAMDERLDTSAAAANARAAGRADLVVALCAGDMSFATAAARRVGAQVAVASRGACLGGPVWQEGVLILGAGTEGRYVGLARLDLDGRRPIRATDVRLRPMDASAPVAPAWRARVEKTVLAVEAVNPGAFSHGE